MRLQALRSKQQARLRCRAGLVYPRGGASIAPFAHHSHTTGRTGRSAADAPDGATLTQLRAPLVLCGCWQRRDAALIEHLREATGQDVAPCFRDKLDLACSVVRNYDISLNYSGIRFPTDRRFPR